MHASFPCPNPVCTHTFLPSAVKGASRLVCPRCGTVFQFGAGASGPVPKPAAPKPPPPRPAVVAPPVKVPSPVSRPAPPPPPARPVAPPVAQPVVPVAAPVGPEGAPGLSFNSQPDVLVRRPVKERGKWRLGPLLALLGVGFLGLLVAVWGVLWMIRFRKLERGVEKKADGAIPLLNARFDVPDKPWERDAILERKMNVNLVLRDPQANNCMAIDSRDYKKRVPTGAELAAEARSKLRSHLKGLETELKKGEEVDLAGQPALLMDFQGTDPERVPMSGECVMMTYRGVAYWFFTWGPLSDREIVSPHWPDLRERLDLVTLKEP